MNVLKENSNLGEHFQINKESGAISISQRKCAELLGVSHVAINKQIAKLPHKNYDNQSLNQLSTDLVNEQKLITEELFFTLVEYYAFESKAKNETALTLYKQIAKAGTRAYLYAQAGYVMQVVESPKVAVYERICASKNTFGVRDVANFYDMRQTDLINLLIERKWIYRYANGNNLRAGSSAKETGLLVQKNER